MSFTATGLLNQYTIDDFFSDPDGDEISFELTNSNSSSVVVFASENEFILRPIAVGEAKLAFRVADSQGGVTSDTITVAVDVVLGAEDGFINNGVGVYPNPVEDMTNVTFSYDWTGDVNFEIIDASGKQHFIEQLDTRTHREVQLDVSTLKSGFYILKASSNGKNATIKLIKK
jgi:hypothetical protein